MTFHDKGHKTNQKHNSKYYLDETKNQMDKVFESSKSMLVSYKNPLDNYPFGC